MVTRRYCLRKIGIMLNIRHYWDGKLPYSLHNCGAGEIRAAVGTKGTPPTVINRLLAGSRCRVHATNSKLFAMGMVSRDIFGERSFVHWRVRRAAGMRLESSYLRIRHNVHTPGVLWQQGNSSRYLIIWHICTLDWWYKPLCWHNTRAHTFFVNQSAL